ncbi:hypothetical protein FIBSPDRAFT_1048949 [Athelia psychrophila]|uniref:Peptidase C14 caspase domain-containing protein n=1 Tax=Athelia psychrophila TaxID=1759441 RepID=A0A166D009_9AGAM|nr:hypothetical protein FIBSPDRAFT_1048949 [Fibularhizoctonia sp. CBS 109695]
MAPIAIEAQHKALLIGINYDSEGETGVLEGSHHNVEVLKNLLIDVYGYKPRDIVSLIDNHAVQNPELRPTRHNILRAIDNLVDDAQAGDHLFFYYSGHSGQVTNRHNSEEDGKDEVIITSDLKDLVDNELRIHLVDPLPAGANLVALLDTCHSGSLLDLEHHRCNRVWTPHISKGYRRTDSRRNHIVRHLAMEYDIESEWNCGIGMTVFTEESISIRASSIDSPKPSPRPLTHQLPSESRSSLPLKMDLSMDISIPAPFFPIMTRCESPTPFWECDGYCRERVPLLTAERANVVCISACEDAQETWESPDGSSLTMVVVSILKDNPHPTLQTLLQQLNFRAHDQARQLHETTTHYKKQRKAFRKGRPTTTRSREIEGCGEKDNFWDPQLASLEPLDMVSCLAL